MEKRAIILAIFFVGLVTGTSYSQTITTVAGGYIGDGMPAADAKLDFPEDVFVDGAGNVYIADYESGRVRRIDASTGIITTVAGGGNAYYHPQGDGGLATEANVPGPQGVFVDGAGHIYIADAGTGRVRKVDATTGIITTVAGGGNQNSDPFGDGGPATDAVLSNPSDLFVDAAGNLFIADRYHYRIRRVDASTGVITTVAGNGSSAFTGDGGAATAAGISFVSGIHVDGAGNIYLTDGNAGRVRRVDTTTGIITTVAGGGSAGWPDFGDGGQATDAQLQSPRSVFTDAAGHLYIGESSRVRRVDAGTGIITTVAGGGTSFPGDGSAATAADLCCQNGGVSADAAGNLYIGHKDKNRIRKVDVSTGDISTLAGGVYTGDGGPAASASLQSADDVFVTAAGDFYIAEANGNRIRKVESGSGTITTVAGGGQDYGEGVVATSAFVGWPAGVFAMASGDLYLISQGKIRKVDAVTGAITTVAGGGNNYAYPHGDGGPATDAVLQNPQDLSVDGAGNIYIVDTYNHRVRKVDAATSTISTIAGSNASGYSGDGGAATSASLNQPQDVFLDGAGNVYIADAGNRVVRKVDPATGIITTIAGGGATGWPTFGDGGAATDAQFNWGAPGGIFVDAAGDLYAADQQKVRKVDAATGVITTVAGTDQYGFSGDGGLRTLAWMNQVKDVVVQGNLLYIADSRNDRIRQADLSAFISETTPASGLSGFGLVQPGAEQQIFSIGITGDGQNTLDAVALTIADLSGATGLAQSDFAELKLYRSEDALLNYNDVEIGSVLQASINIGSPTAISPATVETPAGAEIFYLVTAVIDASATSGHAFTVDLAAGGVATGLGGTGSAVVASDADRLTINPIAAGLNPPDITQNIASINGWVNHSGGSNQIDRLEWDWDDGTTSVNWFPASHFYAATGTYAITVTVYDINGFTASLSTTAEITEMLTPGAEVITTIGGDGTSGFSGDGSFAVDAQLNQPSGDIFVHASGDVYFADEHNRVFRKIDGTTGIITTVAGVPHSWGDAGDGGLATQASFKNPSDIFVDATNNIYLSDWNTGRVRKVDAVTGIITTVAGNGTSGFSGDGGSATAAQLNNPNGIFVDGAGNIYIADAVNQRVRKVDASTNTITTVAGGGSAGWPDFGDGGPATDAALNNPIDVHVDGAGDIYIADRYNQRVRKVEVSTGIITTVAGSGNYGYSGDGGPATDAALRSPKSIFVNGAGDIYIGDSDNHVVRRVDAATGVISTAAGRAEPGYSGDGGSANYARLNWPAGVHVDGAGNIYIADAGNYRVRKAVATPASIVETAPAAGLSGSATAFSGGEVQLFGVGLTGNGTASVDAVTLTISDLSAPTGLSQSDFSALKLYRSADSVLDEGDVEIGSVAPGSIGIGGPTTILASAPDTPPGTERFYLIAAAIAENGVGGHAFKVGFDAGGVRRRK